jgi:hypothetical protein
MEFETEQFICSGRTYGTSVLLTNQLHGYYQYRNSYYNIITQLLLQYYYNFYCNLYLL